MEEMKSQFGNCMDRDMVENGTVFGNQPIKIIKSDPPCPLMVEIKQEGWEKWTVVRGSIERMISKVNENPTEDERGMYESGAGWRGEVLGSNPGEKASEDERGMCESGAGWRGEVLGSHPGENASEDERGMCESGAGWRGEVLGSHPGEKASEDERGMCESGAGWRGEVLGSHPGEKASHDETLISEAIRGVKQEILDSSLSLPNNGHVLNHMGNQSLALRGECFICKKTYPDLKSHLDSKHLQVPKKLGNVKCTMCKKFIHNLDHHLVTFHRQCPICKIVRSNDEELGMHLIKNHRECPQCLRIVPAEDIISHFNICFEDKKARLRCGECINLYKHSDRKFHSPVQLHNHFIYSHRTCKICKHIMFDKQQLKTHQEGIVEISGRKVCPPSEFILSKNVESKNKMSKANDDRLNVKDIVCLSDDLSDTSEKSLLIKLEGIEKESPVKKIQKIGKAETNIRGTKSAGSKHIVSDVDQKKTKRAKISIIDKSKGNSGKNLFVNGIGLTESKRHVDKTVDKQSMYENKCNVCYLLLWDKKSLCQHLSSHEIYRCHECDSEFPSLLSSMMHSQRRNLCSKKSMDKSSTALLTCHICKRNFADHATYLTHMETHSQFKCGVDRCSTLCGSEISLHSHRYSSHGIPIPPDADTGSLTSGGLIEHVVPSTQYLYRCMQCNLSFQDQTNMDKHMALHKYQMFECRSCLQEFMGDSAYLDLCEHMIPHGTYKCSVQKCGAEFISLACMNEHSIDCHHGQMTVLRESKHVIMYQCWKCSDNLSDYKSLCKHLLEHGIYKCDEETCSQQYGSLSTLKGHQIAKHRQVSNLTRS